MKIRFVSVVPFYMMGNISRVRKPWQSISLFNEEGSDTVIFKLFKFHEGELFNDKSFEYVILRNKKEFEGCNKLLDLFTSVL